MSALLEVEAATNNEDAAGNGRTLERTVRAGRSRNCALNVAVDSGGWVRGRIGEVGVVEQIIGLRAHPQLGAFSELEVLVKSGIDIEVTRTVEGVAWKVAEACLQNTAAAIRRDRGWRTREVGGRKARRIHRAGPTVVTNARIQDLRRDRSTAANCRRESRS